MLSIRPAPTRRDSHRSCTDGRAAGAGSRRSFGVNVERIADAHQRRVIGLMRAAHIVPVAALIEASPARHLGVRLGLLMVLYLFSFYG